MEQNRRYIIDQSDLEYNQLMNGIKTRVLNRPLLIEQAPFFDATTSTHPYGEEMQQGEPEDSQNDPELIDIDDANQQ